MPRTAATAGYASLDNDALCIDADLIFDQLADEADTDGLFEADPDLGSAEGEALLLGVSQYA